MNTTLLRAIIGFVARVCRRHDRGALRTRSRSDSGPEAVERWAAACLANGSLDAPVYRSAMEQLAAATDDDPIDISVVVWRAGATSDEELGDLLGALAVQLPELAEPTARAALALHRFGADSDELMRLLRLTGPQAHTIAAADAR